MSLPYMVGRTGPIRTAIEQWSSNADTHRLVVQDTASKRSAMADLSTLELVELRRQIDQHLGQLEARAELGVPHWAR